MVNHSEKSMHNFSLLLSKIDKTTLKLFDHHSTHLACRKGCDQCCMNFRLLPVEFHFIVDQLKEKQIKINNLASDEECPFLVDHECQIYEYRPIICRSHGLPILTMDEEGENWELSFCPLNFTDADDDYFTQKNCYQQDLFNSKLYMLNQEFISNFSGVSYKSEDMRYLKEVVSEAGL